MKEQEYREFYNKASNSLKVAGDLQEIPELELNERFATKLIFAFYYPYKNLVVVIMGKKADPEEVKIKLLHELLHASYPYLSELKIREATETFWWAHKTGKFAV